jgi:hypothetical protein
MIGGKFCSLVGITEREKNRRNNHVSRASLSHGTPPLIRRSHFDVKVPVIISTTSAAPSIGSSAEERENSRAKGAKSFIALCKLTLILGNILPLIYDTTDNKSTTKCMEELLKLDDSFETWEEELPAHLKPNSPLFSRNAPGALNLKVSYLAVKLCLYRVCLLVCLLLYHFPETRELSKIKRLSFALT